MPPSKKSRGLVLESIAEAGAETAAADETRRELMELRIPFEYVDQFPAQAFKAWKTRAISSGVTALVREASEHYPVKRSDYDTFRQIAMLDFFIERVTAEAVQREAWKNLTSINDKGTVGKGEGAMILSVLKQLRAERQSLRASALLTRGSRQNAVVQKEQTDAFQFFAEARRALLERSKQQKLIEADETQTPAETSDP